MADKELQERCAALEKAVFGNGEQGLRVEVAVLTREVDAILAKLTEIDQRQREAIHVMNKAIGGLYILGIVATLVIRFWPK